MSSLLKSPSKVFFIFIRVFLILGISFWFFLRVSISLLPLPICSCMLSIFSIRLLTILITVILFYFIFKNFGRNFINLFIYLFLLCWVFISVRGLSLVAASGGHSSSQCAGLSLSRPLLLWSTGSRHAGSVVVAHGPSCSAACGIFPDQGLNPCPLHWQADYQPLCHQGSPITVILNSLIITKIYVISESDSDPCFVSLDSAFSCLLIGLVIFWWKPNMLYQVLGTEVNRLLVWGFTLIWLGAGLCLMFAVGIRGFNFL